MALLRIDIERALDELASQEEGMRFQGLAVVLGKQRWPELIARQRKKDFGLDAYAPASLAPDGIGKGLAVSITPTLKKISKDAESATKNFADMERLLFATSAKVGNADRKLWEAEIQKDYGVKLFILEREEIITQMLMPENASLCVSFLHLEIDVETPIADIIDRTRRAAEVVTSTWASKTKGHPLVELTAVRIEANGAESAEVQSLERIDGVLSQSGRIVLEGPAGRGKTTTLIQLAQRSRTVGTTFIVELPMWTSSGRGILEFIAGMPAFQAENITAADLARVQQEEPFLFLLNGWNEIAESNSAQADHALRELEREFPSAGIIVATRTHHLMPPLPGAQRLRLRRLRREQRAAYLAARLGTAATALRARIDADVSLDELTRTPFILSEVTSLFEAGAEIPSTKIGILTQVLKLQEERGEHQNALQAAPIFGLQADYLKAMATEMTQRGAVSLYEPDARAISAAVTRELADLGQIESVGAPTILATLTAHHVLERVDYPRTAFQFEHQQLQEFYATLDVCEQLLDLREDDREGMSRFTADYVNAPVWAEPLRMTAEALADHTGDDDTDTRHIRAGTMLVEMALAVDLVFAGELAQLCGAAIWSGVGARVGERFRAVYGCSDESFREYALAAMLATGSGDFSDIVVPLLAGPDQQVRLTTYRLWSEIHVSSLGPNWRDLVRNWNDDVRVDFVSELLHQRVDEEVAAFAAEDSNPAVKEAAASGLLWIGSYDALVGVLDSMDTEMVEDVLRNNADLLPATLRPQSVAAMRKFIESSTDLRARLATTLALIELGEEGLDEAVKDSMAALTSCEFRDLGSYYTEPALAYLRNTDPAWLKQWVASRIETYLQNIETADPDGACAECMLEEMTDLDADAAARVFAKLREVYCRVDGESGQPRLSDTETTRKLERIFRALPADVAATGILRSVKDRDPLDLQIATDLLSTVARPNEEPFRIVDDDLRVSLRTYLKAGVEIVLSQDDFDGKEKANLASSIAQVGQPEDMVDLVTLIRADIERMRRGRSARAAGDRGPVGNGGYMSYAGWHVSAVMQLDPAGAVEVLIDLLPEPEYVGDVAAAMASNFLPKPEGAVSRTHFYDSIWAARDGQTKAPSDDRRRTRFAVALNAEIARLRDQDQDGKPPLGLRELAKALAAIDGHGSAQVILDVIEIPGEWDEYIRLETARLLLFAGVSLPATTAFALVDSVLERSEQWLQDSDKSLVLSTLALWPFFDDPEAGISRLRDVIGKWQLDWGELRTLVLALSKSRSDAAFDLLFELASDPQSFEKCPDDFLHALAVVDTPPARELLLGFVDPDISGLAAPRKSHSRGHSVLVSRLAELSKRSPETAARLRELCEADLPDPSRLILAEVMKSLGTPEAIAANLNLVDDAKSPPVPRGLWDQLKNTFVERRPDGEFANAFTQHTRAENELRSRLFGMTAEDEKRRQSATIILGQIERWRLEYGRPADEPRHPDFASGRAWPPTAP